MAGIDPSLHAVRKVQVGSVALEVLDWHGDGPPLVLLAGLGNTAHIFDDFAPKFTDHWHVLGVTRRGFGASDTPRAGYDVPTLGADVLHVLDALRIARAILVGHSIAGEELTWIAANHRDRVQAMVYLDAAYDRVALREALGPPPNSSSKPPEPRAADLVSPAAYTAYLSREMGLPLPLGEVLAQFEFAADGRFVKSTENEAVVPQLMSAVMHPVYERVAAPILALYSLTDAEPTKLAVFGAAERERFRRALPSARVVVIPHSQHYLFLTNRDRVVREMREFLSVLATP